MNILTLDVETTIANNGNPFDPNNTMCCISLDAGQDDDIVVYDIEYSDNPYGHALQYTREMIDKSDVLCGFNIKFDLHWLRRYGVTSWRDKPIWDVQLAQFIISRQRQRMPSLDQTCLYWGVPIKFDRVKEYWDRGVNTNHIPWDELSQYAANDVAITRMCMDKQLEYLRNNGKHKMEDLIWLSGYDMTILEEMEWNGIMWDVEESLRLAEEADQQLEGLQEELAALYPEIPINIGSNFHVSALLFGGQVKWEVEVPYERTLKNGTVKQAKRKEERSVTLPKLIPPAKGTATATEGYWSVDENVLLNILKLRNPTVTKLVNIVLTYRKLSKRSGTYCNGIPKLISERGWSDNLVHGQLNQCVAVTGRLTSSKPNQQNIDGNLKKLIVSRFNNVD
jgi:DNA polymerase I-like protein with 3'-5' exonuclease and polymerase domains